MANIVWRWNSKKVYVYYYDKLSAKLKQVPRNLTKHLDGKPPEMAHAWVREWEEKHGTTRDRSERIHLKDTDTLSVLWLEYQDLKNSDSDTERRQSTIYAEDRCFFRHIVPYFVGEHQVKNPAHWHSLIPGFGVHLKAKNLHARTRQKILWTLKRFGESLVYSQHMSFPFAIRPPKSANAKITPLKTRKTPEDILAFAKLSDLDSNIDFRLAVLLGYFCGLGPGELFALSKSDFLTSDEARTSAKTYSGFQKHKIGSLKLGTGLSVVIQKTLPAAGKDSAPVHLVKNDFRYGVVNVWHPEAAMLIRDILKTKDEGRLFPFSYGHLTRYWREKVMPKLGSTPHDLRRASGLYLGRTVRLELTLLQEHMRHAEIETTMLYTREPAIPEKTKAKAKQNFDDVA